jgi:branched-subunit amino acid ABC-type transport system permease component
MPKTVKGNLQAALGGFGGAYIADTNSHTPATGYKFIAIQALTDSVVTAVGNITGITVITIPAGFVFYGEYSSITLASGSVFAYQGGES